MMIDRNPGRLLLWMERLKRHPFFTTAVFLGTLIIALASFTDAVKKLADLINTVSPEQARAKLVDLKVPFDTTSFVEAASRGDEVAVNLFLAAGIDPNGKAERGEYARMSALIAAAQSGHLKLVEMLLDHGADANQSTRFFRNDDNALTLAADNGELVDLLLSHSNEEIIRTAFSRSACWGDFKRMQRLWPSVKQQADAASDALLATTHCVTSSPVDAETDSKRLAIVEFLLQNGATPNVDMDGWSPLHNAARNGMVEVVRRLVVAGADVNRRCECSGWLEGGWTPIAMVLDDYRSEYTRLKALFFWLLDQGADVNAASNAGRTLLMLTIEKGDEQMVGRLIAKGADVNARLKEGLDQVRVKDTTPLMWAMDRGGSKLIVKDLLTHGAEVNAVDQNGWSALMWAVWSDNSDTEYLQILLDQGADLHLKDKDGRMALMLAARYGKSQMVEILLARGAERDAVDLMGKTAKDLAEEALSGDLRSKILKLLSRAEAKAKGRKTDQRNSAR